MIVVLSFFQSYLIVKIFFAFSVFGLFLFVISGKFLGEGWLRR